MSHDLYTVAYRMKNLSQAQKNLMVVYAKDQVTKKKTYDLSGAFGSATQSIFSLQNLMYPEADFFCSELVAFAYKSAGIKLEIAASQTTPKDLAHNGLLEYIGHLKLQTMPKASHYNPRGCR